MATIFEFCAEDRWLKAYLGCNENVRSLSTQKNRVLGGNAGKTEEARKCLQYRTMSMAQAKYPSSGTPQSTKSFMSLTDNVI